MEMFRQLPGRKPDIRTATFKGENRYTIPVMSHEASAFLEFMKGQEACQVAFGMFDLQLNWANGGLSCTGRLLYEPSEGDKSIWTEGNPYDAAPLLRLLKQTIEGFEGPPNPKDKIADCGTSGGRFHK